MDASSFRIRSRREIAPDTFLFEVEAPLVARARRAGQFMIITPTPDSERIPISLAGGSREEGTIIFAVQRVGRTSNELCALQAGECFFSILGPLGEPTAIADEYDGAVLCIGGGYGAGAVVPIAAAARAKGHRVIGIIGARDAQRLIFTSEMAAAAEELIEVTEDGSVGRRGRVTDVVGDLLAKGIKIAHVFAIGPVPMMRALAEQTRPLGIGCTVSLNALMVDGTGMCGGCRVSVGGQTRFACCDGPDFDAHQVDFDLLVSRQRMYHAQERQAAAYSDNGRPAADHRCHLDAMADAFFDIYRPVLPEGIDLDATEPLKPKDRMRIPRQRMPEQEPAARIRNFAEVALGLSPLQAMAEARRCLECKHPYCIEGCPVNIEIPSFLKLVAQGDFAAAARKVKESNCLPAICGRVCPQERQCEARCVLNKKAESVAIGRLERFVADFELSMEAAGNSIQLAAPSGKRVAVVGSGPAGLTVAGELARRGHQVVVFEALHKPGGVLVYGIPEFRLPTAVIDAEVENLRRMGVQFITGALIGRSLTLRELKEQEGFDAIFLGTGAGLPKLMGIEGEDLKGSYTANEFLTRINLMRADLFPRQATPVHVGRHVVVIGGGNTAMDCARVARRMGSEEVTILYRRTEAEMPARVEEIQHAKEEGIRFHFLAAPVRLMGDEDGWVSAIACEQMELGEPDASGRRRPVPVPGSEFVLPAETVVSALGFGVNPLLAATTPELKTNKWGIVEVNDENGTSIPGVYAGGDVITGGATVILAMGHGKRAAQAIDEYLRQGAPA
ncbi:MAG TPA: NADPH-dependent glutamate synthase [Candidatus Sumerlaeota bacterium]|nr:NADPH-dependent glutamate synthase [Candidatus Sumerlaeota bacterium]